MLDDPYRYLPTISEFDLYLIGEGRHEELWRVLGAHVREVGLATGTSFAVWAPNARGVRVYRRLQRLGRPPHPMRSWARAGVWELFIPGRARRRQYKFAIRGPDGGVRRRPTRWPTPPSMPPADRVGGVHLPVLLGRRFVARAPVRRRLCRSRCRIYEVHLGSWRRGGSSYRDLAD